METSIKKRVRGNIQDTHDRGFRIKIEIMVQPF